MGKEGFSGKIFIFVLAILFLLTLVSAQPPFIQETGLNEGYAIKVPPLGNWKQNTDFELHFHLFNISNGVPIDNSSTSCFLHFYNSQGAHTIEAEIQHLETNVVNEWEIDVLGGNISQIGDYSYLVQCNSSVSNLGGFESVEVFVTRSGLDSSTGESLIYMVLAFGVLLLFSLSFYFMISTPYKNKVDEKGAVIKITKLKYVKLALILLTWVLFTWFLNILIGLSENFVVLSLYYGFFGFIFDVMNRLALPLGVIIFVMAIFELIRDTNIQDAIKKFGSYK